MRILPAAAAVALLAGTILTGTPAQAHNDGDRIAKQRELLNSDQNIPLISSNNVSLASSNPSSAGISGCFMKTKPLFVPSNLDSVRIYDVSVPDAARADRRTPVAAVRERGDELRGALLLRRQGTPLRPGRHRPGAGLAGDIQHTNAGGGELMIVDVTDPAKPRVAGRAPGSTSTHTVACVQQTNCTYAYSAGDDSTERFSIFDLRNLDHPVEVDSDPKTAGVQGFTSPTAGHKWNFDGAGYGTHTGYDGASMWNTTEPEGAEAGHHHRPRRKGRRPEDTRAGTTSSCTTPPAPQRDGLPQRRGSLTRERQHPAGDRGGLRAARLQHRRLLPDVVGQATRRHAECDRPAGQGRAGRPRDVPDAGGAFCSSHWFDFHPSGIVAAGFYGGGTQFIDVRNPRTSSPTATPRGAPRRCVDSYWMPVYSQSGVMTVQEDQPRLLRRPRPRHRRLPRRPAGHGLGRERGRDRPRGRRLGTGGSAIGVLSALLLAVVLRRRTTTRAAVSLA